MQRPRAAFAIVVLTAIDLVLAQKIEAAGADSGHYGRHTDAGEEVHIAAKCIVIDGATVGGERR